MHYYSVEIKQVYVPAYRRKIGDVRGHWCVVLYENPKEIIEQFDSPEEAAITAAHKNVMLAAAEAYVDMIKDGLTTSY